MTQTGKIKVLTMLTSFHVGGTERQVLNISAGLDPDCFDLHLACLRNLGDLRKHLDQVARIPRPVFDIGRLYSIRTMVEANHLARYIRKNAIQIVHAYGLYPNIFAVPVARLAGARVVIASIRDCGDILKPWQRWLQRITCRLADCVLVNADAIRETLIRQGYRPENIAVIRNGITPQETNPENRSSIRDELGLPSSAPLVMVLSRLNPMKGVEYFLDAASIVAAKLPQTRFLIVGDGAIRHELQDRAIRLGLAEKVVFTGLRMDVPRILAEISVSVLPSLSEGLSNCLLESMSAGVPVIATNVGGNPEIVEHGVSGLLVPPRDPPMLAAAMITMLENPDLASRFGSAGKRKIADAFSVERSVREIERLYRELVDGREGHLPLAAQPRSSARVSSD